MRKGDEAFFYHSNEGKEIVGIAMVIGEAYQDPTTTEDWSVVDFAPVRPLDHPISLARIKADPGLQDMALLRLSRLSVQPVTPEEWTHILALSTAP
jgi:predicted RNA-binding protein with PUA-like domain